MAFKAGSRVLFVGDPTHYGSSHILTHFKEKRIYGEIGDSAMRTKYYAVPSSEVVSFNHELATKIGAFCMASSYLKEIPEEEYPLYDELLAKEKVEYANIIGAMKALCYNPSKVSFMNRTFNFSDKQDMQTNHNYVCTGVWDEKTGNFDGALGARNYRPQCCSFTKTPYDLNIFTPATWINYYGYTVYDLVEWMKFLGKCGIGFKYDYFGVGRLDESFKANGVVETDEHYENIAFGKFQTSIYPKGMSGFHRITVKGDRTYSMHTYLRFICLRYIYNNQYWTIPGHAMQIKKALGGLVTHWEALLMAHLHQPFHGYYALVSGIDRDPKSAEILLKSGDPLTNIANCDRHVDPFQSVETIMQKLQTSGKMNDSFAYLINTLTRVELDKFFAAKDYLGLYKYVKSSIAAKKK